MTTHITTIFDKNYLVRALAFRNSLYKYAPNAFVYLLCLDDEAYQMLQILNLHGTKIMKAEDLGDKELMDVKNNRTLPEFASTTKPALLLYMLNSGKIAKDDLLSFIDPDILFYTSTEKVFGDIYKAGSITITPHKFPKRREHEKYIKGTYNAGMVFFRNDQNSKECLEEWRKQCIKWCYLRYEDGKMGDQGYLSKWPEKYKDTYISEDKGVNLGSWNLENYKITKKDGYFMVDNDPLVCYHFHGLKIYLDKRDRVRAYPITVLHKQIYTIYLDALENAYKNIKKIRSPWTYGFMLQPDFLRILKQKILRILKY